DIPDAANREGGQHEQVGTYAECPAQGKRAPASGRDEMPGYVAALPCYEGGQEPREHEEEDADVTRRRGQPHALTVGQRVRRDRRGGEESPADRRREPRSGSSGAVAEESKQQHAERDEADPRVGGLWEPLVESPKRPRRRQDGRHPAGDGVDEGE